jgi:hypothetical protein
LTKVMRGEVVEGDLDRLIERRAKQKDPEEEHELWRKSVRKYNARHREAVLRQRLEWHEEQLVRHARTFEDLLRRHRVGIRLVEEALGIADGPRERA